MRSRLNNPVAEKISICQRVFFAVYSCENGGLSQVNSHTLKARFERALNLTANYRQEL